MTDQEALKIVLDRVKITERHMRRLDGKLHNDSLAWRDIFHRITDLQHQAHCRVARMILEEETQLARRHHVNETDIFDIEDRLMNNEPVLRKYQVEYNRPAFRGWMSTYDVLRDIIKGK